MSFIDDIIKKEFNTNDSNEIIENSTLIQYLIKKTKSVDRDSKSRGSFANLYAIYVLIEDYINKGFFDNNKGYSKYEGMMFTDAFTRQRELPFGEKLQNHALNNRCNDEFRKFFINITNEVPIIRNLDTQRYWINEKLLIINYNKKIINIAKLCLSIIDEYINLKQKNFNSFFDEISQLSTDVHKNAENIRNYLENLLKPNSDSRIFEIVSYIIIKYYYLQAIMVYSINGANNTTCPLTVYKIGRTNANDGGIDYIMLPLGRVFQVTETLDFKKYFLDIDKLIHYPITFVIKQEMTPQEAKTKIKEEAKKKFTDSNILNEYLNCFEEIITIPTLKEMLNENIINNQLKQMIDELIIQCKVEYNLN